jgi:hypothetical protein
MLAFFILNLPCNKEPILATITKILFFTFFAPQIICNFSKPTSTSQIFSLSELG